MFQQVEYRPIGVVHSGHEHPEQTPIQPCFARECLGHVEIFPQFEPGLTDIEEFSHCILIYHMHKAERMQLVVKPFLEDVEKGVFATRHPNRPNPIGLSVVRLLRRERCTLFCSDIDIIDGTPLLDIKPFVPKFDVPPGAVGGWVNGIDPDVAAIRGKRFFEGAGK